MRCKVRKGSRDDAELNALGSNAVHGLRRTRADKRHAVEHLLAKYPTWTNPRIAKAAGVSVEFVRKGRPAATDWVREGADGKRYPSARQSATVADSKVTPAGAQRALFNEPADPPTLANEDGGAPQRV